MLLKVQTLDAVVLVGRRNVVSAVVSSFQRHKADIALGVILLCSRPRGPFCLLREPTATCIPLLARYLDITSVGGRVNAVVCALTQFCPFTHRAESVNAVLCVLTDSPSPVWTFVR